MGPTKFPRQNRVLNAGADGFGSVKAAGKLFSANYCSIPDLVVICDFLSGFTCFGFQVTILDT